MIRRRSLLPALVLIAFFSALASAQPAAAPDPHQQLDQILHEPMYTAWQQRQAGNIPDVDFSKLTLLEWVRHQLGDFFDWLGRLMPHWNPGPINMGAAMSLPAILKALAWFIGTIAVILIAFLLAKMTGHLRRDAPLPHILSREQIQQAMDSGDALALGTAQWMDEAQRLAAEQNFRAVYRALYLALLSGLHIAGKIEHNRNRTNWTYVQHFHGPDQERSTFSDLTELFDRVWYGRKAAESRNLDELRRTVAALVGGGQA